MPTMISNLPYRKTLAVAAAAAALWACGGSAPTTCGNGRLDKGELCDDGNTADGDGCEADCVPTPLCGNGLVEMGEGCDDGNVINDDACSNACQTRQQPGTDAGSQDGGAFSETGQDAGTSDAGTSDAGTPDAGPPPVTPNPYPHPSHVVVSELQTNGPTGDAADEFVEFYNPTDAEVDLSGHTVYFLNASASITRTLCTFPGSASCTCTGFSGRVPAHGFLLLATDVFAAQSGRPAPDCTWNTNDATGTLSEYGGHLRLVAPDGGRVDVLAFWDGVHNSSLPVAPESAPASGLAGAGTSLERKAVAAATASDMAPGGAHALSGNSCDTDDNGADFVLRTVSGPQNLSSLREP